MESKLTSALTAFSLTITASVAAFLVVGPLAGGALTAINLLALVGWLLTTRNREVVSARDLVGPYLVVPVLLLVLDGLRYHSGIVGVLSTDLASLFGEGFQVTDVTWFFVFVTVPVSLMLLGGYYLSIRTPLGIFMAWWTALYGIVDALFQVFLDAPGRAYDHAFFVGSLVAIGLMVAGVVLLQRLLRHSAPTPTALPAGGLTPRQRNLWSVLFVGLVVVYGVTILMQSGPLPLTVIVGSMMGGMIGWRKTTSRAPADPARAVPLFLLLLALFFVHVGEEALTNFNRAIAAISGTPWSDRDFTLLIGLAGPAVWVFGAWSLWKRQPFGNFIYWFMIVGMILGEPTHLLVFPVVAMSKLGIPYGYFSGMYTALFPMIPAVLSLVMLVSDHRRSEREVHP